MTDKIEQVAHALYLHDGGTDEEWEILNLVRWHDRARAAIAAMREPNESMRRKLWLYGNHPDKEFIMDGGMWREMIDAALECSTKPDEK